MTTTTVRFNDRLGSRGLHHQNLLVATADDGQQAIVRFTGQSLPGLATVLREEYEKNGKWSHHKWTVELHPGTAAFVWSQDWETGLYLTSKTWASALEEVRRKAGDVALTDEAITRFVRATLPNLSGQFDRAAAPAPSALPSIRQAQAELAQAQADLSMAQAELAAAQAAIAEEVRTREAAAEARQDAAEARSRAAKATAALAAAKGGKMDLAALKALLG